MLLQKVPAKWTQIAIGAALGALAFLLIYGVAPLDIMNTSWIMNGHVEKDITCDYAGFLHYINSAWKWPLGVIENIGYPYGNSIAMTAPNVFISLPAKLLSGILPFGAQYFGWWILLCYMLQGAAAAMLTGLFTNQLLAIIPAALVFITSPILAERSFRHCGLAIHFVILLAFYLYIKHCRAPEQGFWWKTAFLSAVSVAVFPYFYPMVLGLVTAALLQTWRRDKSLKTVCAVYAANLAVVPLVGYPIGMFYAKGGAARSGYGYFSLNLNQPFNPISYGDIPWSRVMKVRPIVRGQYDAFNYLGFGVLLCLVLLAVYFVAVRRAKIIKPALSILRRHFLLALLIAGFTVYAVSNVVFYGGLMLFEYPLPEIASKITGLFRSSGRIFYAVYYFIFILCVWGILQICKHKKRLAPLLMTLFLAVQIWDISPGLMWKHEYFAAEQSYENPWQSELLDYVGDNYDKLIFALNPNTNTHELSVLLAQKGFVTNLNASPLESIHQSDEYVRYKIMLLQHGVVMQDEAYVIFDNALFHELQDTLSGKMVAVSDAHFNMLLPILEGKAPPESLPEVLDAYPLKDVGKRPTAK